MNKETKTETKTVNNMLVDLEKKLVEVSAKLPQLPDSVDEFIVKYGPYLMIVGLVFGVLGLLTTFGLMAAFSPLASVGYAYGYGYRYGAHFSLFGLVELVSMVLMAIAIPGLLKRTKAAWNLMFYASFVTAISYLVSMNLGSLIIGMALNWYCLFQIRKFYK
jgi:hypothetical protein